MQPKKITVTGVAASNWIPLDIMQAPFNVAVGCIVVSGTATYNLEYTYDNIFDPTVTPLVWINSVISAATTTKDTVINQPVRAVRLNVTAGVAPVVSFTIIQGLR